MSRHRLLAMLMIAIEATTLGYLSESPTFPILVLGLALVGCIAPMRWSLDWRSEQRLYLLVIVAFIAKHLILPQTFRATALSIATPLSYAVAQCLLTLQVVQFFLRRPHDQLPNMLPGLGAITMACAANVVVRPDERFATQVLVVGFVAIAAFYCTTCRRRLPVTGRHGRLSRAFTVCVLLSTALGAGWASSTGLHHNARGLEDLLGWAANAAVSSASTGFSGKARLDSVQAQKDAHADEIALTVYSSDRPGYMRGRVFDHYESGEWVVPSGNRALLAADVVPQAMANANEHETVFNVLDDPAFARVKTHLDEGRLLECWPDVTLAGSIFAPMGTSHFQADTRSVIVNEHEILESSDLPGGFPYSLYVMHVPPIEAPTPLDREQLLAVPKTLDPRVRELSSHLFADCRTTEDKVAAVENYFVTQYEYQMGIAIPRNAEPLNYFLLNRPAAHCEYFASGAAVLLRLAGVPTRYVTGFVVGERNDVGDCWVAHNRDAHAWAEAFDEQRGWVLVEATPASGQPQPQQASALKQLWDQLRSRLTMFRFRFDQGGMAWLLAAVWGMLTGGAGYVLATAATIIAIVVALRRFNRKRSTNPIDPHVAALHAMLAKMDAQLLRLSKLKRDPGETLHHFAERIRESAITLEPLQRHDGAAARIGERCHDMAQWYEKYASLRYGGHLDDSVIVELRTVL